MLARLHLPYLWYIKTFSAVKILYASAITRLAAPPSPIPLHLAHKMQDKCLVLFSHNAVRYVLDQLSPFSHILQVKYDQPPCPPGQKQFDEVELPCLCQFFEGEKIICSLKTCFIRGA